MAAVQVADGVWRVPTAPADLIDSHLLAGDDGTLVLVDAGTRRAPRTVLAALAQLGRQPGDVTHLLLTHAHSDHAGGARAVVEASGAEVAAHEREAVHLREGRMPSPDPSTRGFAGVDVDTAFADGDALVDVLGLRWSFAGSCTDVRLSRTSAAVLGELDDDVAASTHGPHVASGARTAVRALLAGRPS